MDGRPLARVPAGWSFRYFPDAFEGGGSFSGTLRRIPEYVARGQAKDPDRAAAVAAQRARGQMRRYCVRNRLNRLGTLTYATGNHDPALVREHLGEFFRALREVTGGKPFPYIWIPEWHKTDHGLHAHFAVGKFVKRAHIAAAWDRGFFHIKLLSNLPVGSTSISEARRAAGYLSKYVAKDIGDPARHVLGLHRYDVAQGFAPVPVSISGPTSEDVIFAASEEFGELPSHEWSSRSVEDWQGPPAIWVQWLS